MGVIQQCFGHLYYILYQGNGLFYFPEIMNSLSLYAAIILLVIRRNVPPHIRRERPSSKSFDRESLSFEYLFFSLALIFRAIIVYPYNTQPYHKEIHNSRQTIYYQVFATICDIFIVLQLHHNTQPVEFFRCRCRLPEQDQNYLR